MMHLLQKEEIRISLIYKLFGVHFREGKLP